MLQSASLLIAVAVLNAYIEMKQAVLFLTLLALAWGEGVFHVNFVCLLITFLVLGRLPPNLVTFPENYHSSGAWKKI